MASTYHNQSTINPAGQISSWGFEQIIVPNYGCIDDVPVVSFAHKTVQFKEASKEKMKTTPTLNTFNE
jgi:hypothetical protein